CLAASGKMTLMNGKRSFLGCLNCEGTESQLLSFTIAVTMHLGCAGPLNGKTPLLGYYGSMITGRITLKPVPGLSAGFGNCAATNRRPTTSGVSNRWEMACR